MSSDTISPDDSAGDNGGIGDVGGLDDLYERREPVRRGIPLLLCAVGVPLLAVWALIPVRHHVEDSLKAKSVRALGAAGVNGVEVRMRGRDAHLLGTLPDAASRAQAHEVVRSRVGVRHVDASGLNIGAGGGADTSGPATAFELAIANGRVSLTGVVPNVAMQAALSMAAGAAFGPDHVDGLPTIDATETGAPTDAQLSGIGTLLAGVRPMNVDAVHLAWDGGKLHLRGTVSSDGVKGAIVAKATEALGADGFVDELVVADGGGGSAVADTSVASTAPAAATKGTPTTAAPSTTVATAETTPIPPTTTAGPTTTLTAAAAEVAGDINAVLAAGIVEFDVGSADLTAAGKATVAKLAAALAKQPAVAVAIAGHTDNLGSASRNAQLSQARSDTVKNTLIAQGVAATRLTAKGYGSTKPIADNATAAGRQKNRRIDFTPSGG